MIKRLNLEKKSDRAHSNVTIIKFTAETKKRKYTVTGEQDPLAITNSDLLPTKYTDSVQPLKKKKASSPPTASTLPTPFSFIPLVNIPAENFNIKKKIRKTKIEFKTKNILKVKQHLRSANIDLSESSDESLAQIIKNNKSRKIKAKPKISKNKNNIRPSTKAESGKISASKMIQKSAKRFVNKKRIQNGKVKKSKIVKKNNQTQKPCYNDYLQIIQKYRHLLPEKQPYVRLKPLQFKSHYFTNERPRLTSDINLFRDSALLYSLLGKIFNYLDLNEKLLLSGVCRLWKHALNEDIAWQDLTIKNVVLSDLRPLERQILKRETTTIELINVVICGKATDYEFCRLNSVKKLVIKENCSVQLIKKLIIACTALENIETSETNLDSLTNLSIYVKNLNAENSVISEFENRLLKTWTDLEKLVVHSFDPKYYLNMGLLLSLKYLKVKTFYITNNTTQFIENIPNIEVLQLKPEYENFDKINGNISIVESLKHCPSLKKLTWVIGNELENDSVKTGFKKEIGEDVKKEQKLSDTGSLNPICLFGNNEIKDIDECSAQFVDKQIKLQETDFGVIDTGLEDQILTKPNIYPKSFDDSKPYESLSFEENLCKKSSQTEIHKENKIKNQSAKSLQFLSFKTYVSSSLPDCDVIFKTF